MTEREWIDCRTLCRHFNYDSWGDDDYEVCDKGHELYPTTCPDFKIKHNKQHFKMDSFGIYDGEYVNRMDRLEIYRKLNEQYETIMELSIENNALRKDKQKVTETLQEAYQLTTKSHVFKADQRSGKYLGQLLQQSNLRLLLKLAEKLEVDLK